MIPVLQNENEKIGFLKDAISCTVTEERNGIFELEMTYPIGGQHAEDIEIDKIILAKPNDTLQNQMFRIYEVSKPLNGIFTIKAEHISYELSALPITRYTATNANATTVIAGLVYGAEKANDFRVYVSDITTRANFKVEACSVRAALGGVEGSVLDTFGGEFIFDNYYVQLKKNRGSDTGVIISYGKNLTDVSLTISDEDAYTGIYPYAYNDTTLVTLSEKIIDVTNTTFSKDKILIMDFSSEFDSDTVINEANLRTIVQKWLTENDINAPSITLEVSFQHLWKSPEYANFQALEKVSLCDIVNVWHEGLGIHIKAKVIKTVYNTLSENYESLVLGSARSNFADTILQNKKEIERIKNQNNSLHSQITEEYESAIEEATQAITGYSGGYVVLNPSEHPQELLIMERPSISQSSKSWRFNMGGLGYSSNGYSGPFKTAITMNGQINADFITTGTLTANIIRAGILTATDGTSYFNVESGYFSTCYANITGGYISIGGSEYRTVIENGSIWQHLNNNTVGALVPIGDESHIYQGVVCSSAADGIFMGYELYNWFEKIALFGKSRIDFNKTTYINGAGLIIDKNIITNEVANDTFTAIKHYRTKAFNGSGTTAYTAEAYFGLGNVMKKPSVAIQVMNYTATSPAARLDVYRSDGEAYICMRGSSDGSNSKELELGAQMWWNGIMNATKYQVSSTEDIKENITESESVLDLFRNSTIYQYNLIDEEPENEPYDGDEPETNPNAVAPIQEAVSGDEGEPSHIDSIDDEEPGQEPEPEQPTSLGFVIGRETPAEVISEDGEHIDLYSMAAVTWKGVQELLSRIENLEARIAGE